MDARIVVPFAPGTEASGIESSGPPRRCWYRREVELPALLKGERAILHFGAVDHRAKVWVDGHLVAEHTGGFTPFTADVTGTAGASRTVELVVRADDAAERMDVPRGKQDWWPTPHAIWYPGTCGIWQTVWLEHLPAIYVADLVWSGDPQSMSVELTATIEGAVVVGDTLEVALSVANRLLVQDNITVTEVIDHRATLTRTFAIGRPGFDDPLVLVWHPRSPVLIDAAITVRNAETTDHVASYTAIRSVGVTDGRFALNGRPYRLRLALDQGYWPQSGMTAPSVEALREDVNLVKALGLNGVRKHQKIEDPRWLAMCDELGVLVWEELPSAYAFNEDLGATLSAEWSDVVRRDRNHPCIVAWVPVNESWGVPNIVNDRRQQALVAALASLTTALDPSRPVSANDGWETIGGDLVGIHDYEQDPDVLRARYSTKASVAELFDGFGPGKRRLTVDGLGPDGRAIVLSEFGGTTLSDDPSNLFSYGNTTTSDEFVERYRELCAAALSSEVLSGYCWTQLTDTFQEANGLLHMDRTPKAPMESLRAASRGARPTAIG